MLRRPDLEAAAALIVEPTLAPSINLRIRQLCLAAAAALPRTETSLRLLVTARLADTHHYLGDYAAAHAACAELERLTGDSNDATAIAAALHAQQLKASGPAGVDVREQLAGRLADVATASRNPTEESWAHLWLIDVALQRGDTSRARRELDAAHRVGADTSDLIVHWQFLRAEATVAQAQARYDDATRLGPGRRAADRRRQPARRDALGGSADVHPLPHRLRRAVRRAPRPPGRGQHCARPARPDSAAARRRRRARGRRQRAAALYRALGPVSDWEFAPHATLFTWAYGVIAAVALAEREDVGQIRRCLADYRGHHVASAAGGIAYFGPVELWLGVAAAALGDYDQSIPELEHALVACGGNGAAGFQAQVQVELAEVHAHRGGAGDMRRARSLAGEALQRAELIGMRPVATRARLLLGRADPSDRDALTNREQQVAELVGDGLTNRAIANRLYLSDRTVANHVQHIFDKLGLTNRSQLVSWLHERRDE